MSLSIWKTRASAELCGRVTPARETQDSRKYGFDSPFSHYFLDLRPQKISCSVYISCANWVEQRAKRQKICTIIACEKHLKKGKLHRRILRKNGVRAFLSKTPKKRNNRYLWNIDYFYQDPPYTLASKKGIYASPEGVHTWSRQRGAKTDKCLFWPIIGQKLIIDEKVAWVGTQAKEGRYAGHVRIITHKLPIVAYRWSLRGYWQVINNSCW